MLVSELTGAELETYNANVERVAEIMLVGFPVNWAGFERGTVDSLWSLTTEQKETWDRSKAEIFTLLTAMPDTSFKRRWLRDLFTAEDEE